MLFRSDRHAGDTALPDLLFHARAAGDLAAAARHAERAVERAVRAGDPAEAVRLLRDLLDDAGLPAAARAEFARRVGRLALTGLAHDDTVALLRRILTDDRLPDGVRGELRMDLALLLGNQAAVGDPARAELKRAVVELRRRPLLAARAMSALAMPYWGTGHVDEHLGWLARAERILPARGDPVLRAAVAVNLHCVRLQLGEWSPAPEPADDVTGEELAEHVRGHVNFANTAIAAGRLADARAFLDRAADWATRAGATYLLRMGEANSLRLAWATGRWDGLAERAGRLLAADRTQSAAAEASLVLGLLALARGEWDEAGEYLAAPGLAVPAGWCGATMTAAGAARVRLRTACGDTLAAVSELDGLVDVVRAKGGWAWSAEVVDAGVDALLRAGLPERARDLADEFAADVARRGSPLGRAVLLRCRGALAADPALLTEAAEVFAALPMPYERARAIEAAALVRPDGTAELGIAARLFADLGATWDAARCEHALRERGGAAGGGPGRRGYGDELSPREREVARLIALGRTNKEIAAVLFLSARTVERHVAGVFRKLGVHRRDQVRLPDQV